MSKNKIDDRKVFIIAALIVVFVLVAAILRKLLNYLNTEPPVLDEASKKILNDKKLVEDYYAAIEKERKGESGNITIEGEEYKIIRAGKYSQPVVAH